MTVAPEELAHIDFETRSDVNLKKSGVYRYAQSKHTGIYCLAWHIGDEPTQSWAHCDPFPERLADHVRRGGKVVAHNAGFERTVWNNVLRRMHPELPELRVEQQVCTLARAAALSLPLDLDSLGAVLGLRQQKSKEGHALMMRMCKPIKELPDGTPIFNDDPLDLLDLMAYAEQDARTEHAADKSMPYLSAREQRVWELDQTINDRGIRIDERLVNRFILVAEEAMRRANDKMWTLTNAEVSACTQTQKIIRWLNDRGIQCESVAKGEIEDLKLYCSLAGDDTARQVIELRRSAAKSSLGKLKKMKETVCSDSRVRGCLQYHGAATGRWSGRLIQPQNLVRVDEERDLPHVNTVLDLLGSPSTVAEVVDALEVIYDLPLDILPRCMRAMFLAGHDKKFVGGDFSNIEGRVNAWFANERWKLEAFRAYDRKEGPDLYNVAYASSFGIPVEEVKGPQRQIGKVQELALGYQGGPGAYVNMAANYMIRPEDIARVARDATSIDEWLEVRETYSPSISRGLDIDTWTGIKIIVNKWRSSNKNIMNGWWSLQDAAIEAVGAPGTIVPVTAYAGRVRYMCSKSFLFCQLPSKRIIAYPNPRLVETKLPSGSIKYSVQYEGVDSLSKKWGKQSLYGGMQCNHVVQGTARDAMVESMFAAEAAGYPVVLTVHDELVTEVPDTADYSAATLKKLMAAMPPYLDGLPLAVKTWEDYRYTK